MNKQKWNAACDILFERLNRRDPYDRAVTRDEGCCHELEAVKDLLMKTLSEIRQ